MLVTYTLTFSGADGGPKATLYIHAVRNDKYIFFSLHKYDCVTLYHTVPCIYTVIIYSTHLYNQHEVNRVPQELDNSLQHMGMMIIQAE